MTGGGGLVLKAKTGRYRHLSGLAKMTYFILFTGVQNLGDMTMGNQFNKEALKQWELGLDQFQQVSHNLLDGVQKWVDINVHISKSMIEKLEISLSK